MPSNVFETRVTVTDEASAKWEKIARATMANLQAQARLKEEIFQAALVTENFDVATRKLARSMQEADRYARYLKQAKAELRAETKKATEATKQSTGSLDKFNKKAEKTVTVSELLGQSIRENLYTPFGSVYLPLNRLGPLLGTTAGALLGVAGMTALAGAAAIKLTTNYAEQARTLQAQSREYGVSTTMLQALRLEAEKAGVETGQITFGMRTLTRVLSGNSSAMQEAGLDTARTRTLLQQYGLTGLSTGDALEKLLTVLHGMSSETQKQALLFALVGTRGAGLLPVLEQLSNDGYQNVIDKLRESGDLLTEQDIKAGQLANSSLVDLKEAWGGVSKELERAVTSDGAGGILELITGIGKAVHFAVKELNDFGDAVQAISLYGLFKLPFWTFTGEKAPPVNGNPFATLDAINANSAMQAPNIKTDALIQQIKTRQQAGVKLSDLLENNKGAIVGLYNTFKQSGKGVPIELEKYYNELQQVDSELAKHAALVAKANQSWLDSLRTLSDHSDPNSLQGRLKALDDTLQRGLSTHQLSPAQADLATSYVQQAKDNLLRAAASKLQQQLAKDFQGILAAAELPLQEHLKAGIATFTKEMHDKQASLQHDEQQYIEQATRSIEHANTLHERRFTLESELLQTETGLSRAQQVQRDIEVIRLETMTKILELRNSVRDGATEQEKTEEKINEQLIRQVEQGKIRQAQMAQYQKDLNAFAEGAGHVFDAMISRGGSGLLNLQQYLQGLVASFGRTIFVNVAKDMFGMLSGHGGNTLSNIFEGTPLDRLFGGTQKAAPQVALTAATTTNTTATATNTAAITTLTDVLGTSFGVDPVTGMATGSAGSAFASIFGSGVNSSGTGRDLSPLFGLTVPPGTPGFGDNTSVAAASSSGKIGAASGGFGMGGGGLFSKGGNKAQNIGLAVGGGLTLANGIMSHNAGEDISGGMAIAAAIDPEPISKAVLAIGSMVVGAFSGLFGNSQQQHENDMKNMIESEKFLKPATLQFEQNSLGQQVDYGSDGSLRALSPAVALTMNQALNTMAAIDAGQTLLPYSLGGHDWNFAYHQNPYNTLPTGMPGAPGGAGGNVIHTGPVNVTVQTMDARSFMQNARSIGAAVRRDVLTSAATQFVLDNG